MSKCDWRADRFLFYAPELIAHDRICLRELSHPIGQFSYVAYKLTLQGVDRLVEFVVRLCRG